VLYMGLGERLENPGTRLRSLRQPAELYRIGFGLPGHRLSTRSNSRGQRPVLTLFLAAWLACQCQAISSVMKMPIRARSCASSTLPVALRVACHLRRARSLRISAVQGSAVVAVLVKNGLTQQADLRASEGQHLNSLVSPGIADPLTIMLGHLT
jgi:hypothetical protein